jgi:hypothetical protein
MTCKQQANAINLGYEQAVSKACRGGLESRQLEASLPPGVVHQANHLDDGLIRKSVSRRAHGAARLGK